VGEKIMGGKKKIKHTFRAALFKKIKIIAFEECAPGFFNFLGGTGYFIFWELQGTLFLFKKNCCWFQVAKG
jgi:hypothetical protein